MKDISDNSNICPHCGYADGTPRQNSFQLEPGSILRQKYTVGKVLGCGGFGITYVGKDFSLDRKVAIKEYFPSKLAVRAKDSMEVVPAGKSESYEYNEGLRRFFTEAKNLAKFNYVKGIVDIYEVFYENGTGYIVMECLEGDTLKQLIAKNGTMPYESARLIVSDMLNTLAIVHRENIIHRDISPDNVFVTLDNKIKLIDFGAAKYYAGMGSDALSVILRPGFAPEEQYSENGVQGPWTDVYAVAATMYYMLTGKRVAESKERIVADNVLSPIQLGVKLPSVADATIMKALSVHSRDRIQSAQEFLDGLVTYTQESSSISGKTSDSQSVHPDRPTAPKGLNKKIIAISSMAVSAFVIMIIACVFVLPKDIEVDNSLTILEYSTDGKEYTQLEYSGTTADEGTEIMWKCNPIIDQLSEDDETLYLNLKPQSVNTALELEHNESIISPDSDGKYAIALDERGEIKITLKPKVNIGSTKPTVYLIPYSRDLAELDFLEFETNLLTSSTDIDGFSTDVTDYTVYLDAGTTEIKLILTPEDSNTGFNIYAPGIEGDVIKITPNDNGQEITANIRMYGADADKKERTYNVTFNIAPKEQKKQAKTVSSSSQNQSGSSGSYAVAVAQPVDTGSTKSPDVSNKSSEDSGNSDAGAYTGGAAGYNAADKMQAILNR